MAQLVIEASAPRKREWCYVWANVVRFVKGEPLIHCWADARDQYYNGYSCMRANGHLGACDFVPDHDIGVSFQGQGQ